LETEASHPGGGTMSDNEGIVLFFLLKLGAIVVHCPHHCPKSSECVSLEYFLNGKQVTYDAPPFAIFKKHQ